MEQINVPRYDGDPTAWLTAFAEELRSRDYPRQAVQIVERVLEDVLYEHLVEERN